MPLQLCESRYGHITMKENRNTVNIFGSNVVPMFFEPPAFRLTDTLAAFVYNVLSATSAVEKCLKS